MEDNKGIKTPLGMVNFSEEDFRDFLRERECSEAGCLEVLRDRAVRAFYVEEGDASVTWLESDNANPDGVIQIKYEEIHAESHADKTDTLDNIEQDGELLLSRAQHLLEQILEARNNKMAVTTMTTTTSTTASAVVCQSHSYYPVTTMVYSTLNAPTCHATVSVTSGSETPYNMGIGLYYSKLTGQLQREQARATPPTTINNPDHWMRLRRLDEPVTPLSAQSSPFGMGSPQKSDLRRKTSFAVLNNTPMVDSPTNRIRKQLFGPSELPLTGSLPGRADETDQEIKLSVTDLIKIVTSANPARALSEVIGPIEQGNYEFPNKPSNPFRDRREPQEISGPSNHYPAWNNRPIATLIRDWKITFSGDRKMSVENFLSRVEECRAISYISDEQLLLSMPLMLTGIALLWFRQNNWAWPTWESFRSAFRARFGDVCYQRRLEEQVIHRIQGPDESTIDYLTCMQGLYHMFERFVSMDEQMDRVYLNLRVELKRQIKRREFGDYNDLAMIATDVERMLESVSEERKPQKPEESFIPEFAYQESDKAKKKNAIKQEKKSEDLESKLESLCSVVTNLVKKLDNPRSNANNNKKENKRVLSDEEKEARKRAAERRDKARREWVERTPLPEPPCFNCKEGGHGWRECKKTWHKFCHVCGKADRIKYYCDSSYCKTGKQENQ